MRKIIFIFILLNTIKGISQCTTPITFSIQTTPESCIGCCDGSAQIINLTGDCIPFYTILWQPTLSSTILITNLCSGSYSATVSGSCCPSIMLNCFITTNITTLVKQGVELDFETKLSPNPNNGNFLIISNVIKEYATILITNTLGETIVTFPYTPQVDISTFQNGMYYLTIQDGTSKKTIKFIKQ
jgi:hypothetical protein